MAIESRRFIGKVVLITGAGSGIGRAIALRLSEEGASVFAVDIVEDRLKETQALAAGPVVVHQADLADPAACPAAVAACVAELGRLDVLGNNAGIYFAEHAPKVTLEAYRRMMAINLDAYFFLCQAAIPHLLEVEGNIVNIASNAGLMGMGYSTPYCMTKGGVVQMTRALATEYIKTPLRVNAIAPSGTNTNLAAGSTFPPDLDPELMGAMVGMRGKMSEPEEIAALFALLASAEIPSVTGAIYSIDNGVTAY